VIMLIGLTALATDGEIMRYPPKTAPRWGVLGVMVAVLGHTMQEIM
jgi:hypothetical protein